MYLSKHPNTVIGSDCIHYFDQDLITLQRYQNVSRICGRTYNHVSSDVSYKYKAQLITGKPHFEDKSTMGLFCSMFTLVSLLCWLLVSAAPNSTSIYFSYITTKTGAGFRSGGAIPVVDLALEQINNRTDILPNYTLSYRTIRDSKVNN